MNADDLLVMLDSDPKLCAAIRSRILTQDLLDLPKIVGSLANHQKNTDRSIANLTATVEKLGKRVDQLAASVVELRNSMVELRNSMDELRNILSDHIRETNRRFADVYKHFKKLDDSTGILLGAHICNVVAKKLPTMVGNMGFRLSRELDRAEICSLVNEAEQTGKVGDIRPEHLDSLREVDVMVNARDTNGKSCYVVVEISHTIDSHDVERALRHARIVTKFANAPIYAAVAGRYYEENVAGMVTKNKPLPAVSSDVVFMYNIKDKHLQPR